jgi:hypothetical protein
LDDQLVGEQLGQLLLALQLRVAIHLQLPEFFLDDQLADEPLVQLLLVLRLRVALQLPEFFLDDQLSDEPLVQLLLALQLRVVLQDDLQLQVLQELDADFVEQDDQLVDADQQLALLH